MLVIIWRALKLYVYPRNTYENLGTTRRESIIQAYHWYGMVHIILLQAVIYLFFNCETRIYPPAFRCKCHHARVVFSKYVVGLNSIVFMKYILNAMLRMYRFCLGIFNTVVYQTPHRNQLHRKGTTMYVTLTQCVMLTT